MMRRCDFDILNYNWCVVKLVMETQANKQGFYDWFEDLMKNTF